MSGKFKFTGKATIAHLNARKEGPEDERDLAVDVKLELHCLPEVCDFFDEHLRAFLYTDVVAVRNAALGPITFSYELKNYELLFRLIKVHQTNVTLKKITLTPGDRKATLTLLASFTPTSTEVAMLAECLGDKVQIILRPLDGELAFPEDALAPVAGDSAVAAEVKKAARKLRDTLRKDGATAEIKGPSGETLAKIG